MLLGERGSGSAKDRAERSHAAPVAQGILSRCERVVLDVAGDGVPQLVNVTLKVRDVSGLRIEGNDLAGFQVDKLHARRKHLRTREEQRVETQLIQGLVHVARAGCLSGLVIHDPQTPVGGTIHAIDETEETHAARGRRCHALLERSGRNPLRLLDRKVPVDNRARLVKPRITVRVVTK